MRATKKEEEAMFECYRRLYKNSSPEGDFDKMVEEAEVNDMGQKVIDFNAYEIPEEKAEEIIKDIIKEYKIKPKIRANAFKTAIYLGCSPRFSNCMHLSQILS